VSDSQRSPAETVCSDFCDLQTKCLPDVALCQRTCLETATQAVRNAPECIRAAEHTLMCFHDSQRGANCGDAGVQLPPACASEAFQMLEDPAFCAQPVLRSSLQVVFTRASCPYGGQELLIGLPPPVPPSSEQWEDYTVVDGFQKFLSQLARTEIALAGSAISCDISVSGDGYAIDAAVGSGNGTVSMMGVVDASGHGQLSMRFAPTELEPTSGVLSGPCSVTVLPSPTSPGNLAIQPGLLWASFDCPELSSGQNTCVAQGPTRPSQASRPQRTARRALPSDLKSSNSALS
jgi:hypothetical protein